LVQILGNTVLEVKRIHCLQEMRERGREGKGKEGH